MEFSVVGVYPVPAPEPVHLVEVVVTGCDASFDLGSITQPVVGQPRDNWQVSWDEHFLDVSGCSVLNPDRPEAPPGVPDFRVAFFYHYLNFDHQLETPFGPVDLPAPSQRPARLAFLKYEEPC